MSGEAKTEGGCQCGAIRFAAAGEPLFVCNCHCRSCRKATGAAFSTWIGFADDKVAWSRGAPSVHVSSPGVRRGYCAACGTPLTYSSDKWPGETHFLIGVLDDPAPFIPCKDVFTEDALDWAPRAKGEQ